MDTVASTTNNGLLEAGEKKAIENVCKKALKAFFRYMYVVI